MDSELQRPPRNICSTCADIKGAVLVLGECSELSLQVFTSWSSNERFCSSVEHLPLPHEEAESAGPWLFPACGICWVLCCCSAQWQHHRDQTQLLSLCQPLQQNLRPVCWSGQVGEKRPVSSSAAHLSSLNESLHLLR